VTATTLVTGSTAQAREAAIAAHLDPAVDTALILEGLPSGNPILAETSSLRISRIAPGCLCCTGNLTMRVTLNRLLRRPPQRLFISLATSEHVDRLRDFLAATPYDILLELTQDLHA
jgi:G3E family GTPase